MSYDDFYDIVMLTGDFKEYADGDRISAWLEDTGTMWEYVTVLGAIKKVSVYRIPEPMTPAGLQAALQAGATYDLDYGTTEIVCSTCKGTAFFCPACASAEKITVPQPMRVNR